MLKFFALTLSLMMPAVSFAIFNGTQVPREELRAVVAVGKNHCTGTLISKTEVVTAAHCVFKTAVRFQSPIIRDFEHKVRVETRFFGSELYDVEYAVVHPLFSRLTRQYDNYDVAYLKLKKSVKIKDEELIQIYKPQNAEKLIGKRITIAGFGVNDKENLKSVKLKAEVKINSSTEKSIYLGGNGTSTCFGDSGGPALLQTEDGPKIVGISSDTTSAYREAHLACLSEARFAKASMAYELVQSQRLIERALNEGHYSSPNISLLNRSIEEYPEASWAYFWKAIAVEDESSIAKALELMPWSEQFKLNDLTLDRVFRAKGFLAQGENSKSISLLKELEESSQLSEQGYELLVKAYSLIDKYLEAFNTISKAMEKFPGSYELSKLMVDNYLFRQNISEAQKLLNTLGINKETILLQLKIDIYNKDVEQALLNINRAERLHANMNHLFSNKRTLLQEAFVQGVLEVADRLLDMNVITNNYVKNGSAVSLASNMGDIDLLSKLLDKGGNTNISDQYGNTPLHIAAYNGNLESVRKLVEYSAITNIGNAYGQKALDFAKMNEFQAIIDFLEDQQK